MESYKKVRRVIRLYSIHDLDIVTYFVRKNVNITQVVYCILHSFTQGKRFCIKSPETEIIEGFTTKNNSMEILLSLNADNEYDSAIIDLFDKIHPRYRNIILKNVIRLYMGTQFDAQVYMIFTKLYTKEPEYFNDIFGQTLNKEAKQVDVSELYILYKTLKGRKVKKRDMASLEDQMELSFVEEQSSKTDSVNKVEEVVKNNSSDEVVVEDNNEMSVMKDTSNDTTETEDANDIFDSIM